MKIKITAPGIYDGTGTEITVGTEFEVEAEPTGWAGRYTVLEGGNDDQKTGINNDGYKAEHHGGGKFRLTHGESVLRKDLTKAQSDAFNALSAEDKEAFGTLSEDDQVAFINSLGE